MRNIITLIALWFSVTFGFSQTGVIASSPDGYMLFGVEVPATENLSETQKAKLTSKMKAILARSAMGGNENSAYVLVPTVNITNKETTESSISPITVVNGELTIIAKNRFDDTAYNELTIPVKASYPVSTKSDDILFIINAINIHDKRIVRFLKVTQQRIANSKSK